MSHRGPLIGGLEGPPSGEVYLQLLICAVLCSAQCALCILCSAQCALCILCSAQCALCAGGTQGVQGVEGGIVLHESYHRTNAVIHKKYKFKI